MMSDNMYELNINKFLEIKSHVKRANGPVYIDGDIEYIMTSRAEFFHNSWSNGYIIKFASEVINKQYIVFWKAYINPISRLGTNGKLLTVRGVPRE